MSRPYSQEFIDYVMKTDSEHPGADLAKLCIRANLPSAFIADHLGVSRMTVYAWFRSKPIRFKNRLSVESLIQRLEDDLKRGVLPVDTKKGAKEYLAELGTA